MGYGLDTSSEEDTVYSVYVKVGPNTVWKDNYEDSTMEFHNNTKNTVSISVSIGNKL